MEATEDEARELADGLIRWLVKERIIVAELTDCVLGERRGYRPGPNYVAAGYEGAPGFLRTSLNGVEVDPCRRVYYTHEGLDSLTCRFCGTGIVVLDEAGNHTKAFEDIQELIQGWDETGEGRGWCAGCGRQMSLNDWDWAPLPWGFAYLGLVFWNWPGLRPEFIAEVGHRLGHRTIYTGAKL